MQNNSQADLRKTSDNAAFYALVCLIPIFLVVVTYGWGHILKPLLPIPAPFDTIVAFILGIFLAIVGIVLAKVIAAERVQISLLPDSKGQFGRWISRCWAYLLVLLAISALGTTRTIFTMSQASDVLSNELSQTGSELRALQVAIDSVLKTPEYDTLATDYKAKRAKVESLVNQFQSETDRTREVELSNLNNARAKIDSLWVQFEGEMKNPQLCGFGPVTQQRFKELQKELPGLQQLAGNGGQCDKVPAILAQYKTAVESLKNSQFSASKYNCPISPVAALRWSEIQAALPELKPLPAVAIPCDKMPEVVKKYVESTKPLIAGITVPATQTPTAILEFKQKASGEIQQQLKDIDNIVINSAKVSTDDALPVLRKSWETYRKNLAECETLAGDKRTNLPKDIKREEVENIENLSNILRILASRWDNFMTYLTLLAAVLLDLILITFFKRHLSSNVQAVEPSAYDSYASGDNIFKN